jgi:hypothetical protein
VENEAAKNSTSWKRCSAVTRARTAAAPPHSYSSPNLQTSHKVRLLARSHLRACQCSEEERGGLGFGEGGRARHRRCPPAAPARCSRSGWVRHLVPSSALSFVGLPTILNPFFFFFFEIDFEGGDFSIRNFHIWCLDVSPLKIVAPKQWSSTTHHSFTLVV